MNLIKYFLIQFPILLHFSNCCSMIFKNKNIDKYVTLSTRNINDDDGNGENNGLLELLYHLAIVLNHSKSDFVALFKALAKNPQILQVSYFAMVKIKYCQCHKRLLKRNTSK